MKVYDFIIVIKTTHHTLVDTVSRMMLLLSIALFGYTISHAPINKYSILLMVLMAGMIAWWIYCYLRQKKGRPVFYRLGLLMATAGWLTLTRFSWITILFFIAVLLEKQVKFPQEIAFDENGIVFNTLPKKYYPWSAIKNAVLKDGILTIDFASNKLYQKEIDNPGSAGDEQDFNEFCSSKLNTVHATQNA